MAHLGSVRLAPGRRSPPGPFSRTGRLAAAALITLALAATTAALIGVVFSPADWPRARQAGGKAALAGSVAPAKGPPPAAPSSREWVREPDPRSITLTARDLPGGYHVLREGPAAFSSGGGSPAPPSWDVVFEPDLGQRGDYQLAESLVVVYATPSLAGAALDAQANLERGVRASEQPSPSGVGDRATAWLEPVPDRPQYTLVRVTWKSLNVVAQVSVLGVAAPGQLERTLGLATAQQERIAAPAPARSDTGT